MTTKLSNSDNFVGVNFYVSLISEMLDSSLEGNMGKAINDQTCLGIGLIFIYTDAFLTCFTAWV